MQPVDNRDQLPRRHFLPLTQAELAERAGISKRTLEPVESGRGAELVTVVRILPWKTSARARRPRHSSAVGPRRFWMRSVARWPE